MTQMKWYVKTLLNYDQKSPHPLQGHSQPLLCTHLPQTSKSPVTIMVWKEGASADTSQLYLPDEATFSPTSISWLSLEATRCKKKKDEKNEIIVCKKKCTMSHNSVLVRNVSRAFQLCVQWWQMNMGNSNYSQVGFGRGAVGGSSSHLGFAHVWDNRGFHAVMNIAMVDLVDSIEGY